MAWDDSKSPGDLIASADYNSMVSDQKTRGIPKTENKRGLDCSGSDDTVGRVLTLANTAQTKSEGWRVTINKTEQHDSDVTFTHNSSSSTITFTNIEIRNDDYIKVTYFV